MPRSDTTEKRTGKLPANHLGNALHWNPCAHTEFGEQVRDDLGLLKTQLQPVHATGNVRDAEVPVPDMYVSCRTARPNPSALNKPATLGDGARKSRGAGVMEEQRKDVAREPGKTQGHHVHAPQPDHLPTVLEELNAEALVLGVRTGQSDNVEKLVKLKNVGLCRCVYRSECCKWAPAAARTRTRSGLEKLEQRLVCVVHKGWCLACLGHSFVAPETLRRGRRLRPSNNRQQPRTRSRHSLGGRRCVVTDRWLE
jgi:hypothetical protein